MSQRTTKTDFLERAIDVHGEKYDYSKIVYTTTETKVIIICEKHGEFLLRPRAHYADKRGCPKCDKSGKSGFHKSKWVDKSKYIYLIELFGNGERFLKFGVTVSGVKGRVIRGEIPYTYETLFEKKIKDGEKAIVIEKKLKSKYLKIPYVPELTFRGDTECLELGIKEHLIKDLNRIIT
tara:strand:+ start:18382 stop:18918 length:537 start_codon:yes stop_codon:yes gene_type:complete